MNRGDRVFLTSNNLTGKFKWKTDLNLARNYNEILDIQGQSLPVKTMETLRPGRIPYRSMAVGRVGWHRSGNR